MNSSPPPPSLPPRQARRALQRIAARVDQAEARYATAARDLASVIAARNGACGVVIHLEAGGTVDFDPQQLLVVADRHSAHPRFRSFRSASTTPLDVARAVLAAAEDALFAVNVEVDRLEGAVLDAQTEFARTLGEMLPSQPGLRSLFVGALSSAGLALAADDAMTLADRFRAWLGGRSVNLAGAAA